MIVFIGLENGNSLHLFFLDRPPAQWVIKSWKLLVVTSTTVGAIRQSKSIYGQAKVCNTMQMFPFSSFSRPSSSSVLSFFSLTSQSSIVFATIRRKSSQQFKYFSVCLMQSLSDVKKPFLFLLSESLSVERPWTSNESWRQRNRRCPFPRVPFFLLRRRRHLLFVNPWE